MMALTDMLIALISIFALLNSSNAQNQEGREEKCFTFYGNSYLMFLPSGQYNGDNSAHYQLKFRTTALNGLLMYSRGDSDTSDWEALYIRAGHLNYHLFNSGAGGLGRQFGGHFVSTEMVNTNAWFTVDVYRAMLTINRAPHSQSSEWKTGFEFELDGTTRSYVDSHPRHHIDISNTIYFGGFQNRLSESVGNFTGEIGGIQELVNGYTFEYPSLNYKSLVDLECLLVTPQ